MQFYIVAPGILMLMYRYVRCKIIRRNPRHYVFWTLKKWSYG